MQNRCSLRGDGRTHLVAKNNGCSGIFLVGLAWLFGAPATLCFMGFAKNTRVGFILASFRRVYVKPLDGA